MVRHRQPGDESYDSCLDPSAVGQTTSCPGRGMIGARFQAVRKALRNCCSRSWGRVTSTTENSGKRFKTRDADSPKSRSRVSRHEKPAATVASTKLLLLKAPQPRACAVPASILNSFRSRTSLLGMLTSSSHMWDVELFCRNLHDFSNSLVGKWSVSLLNFFHAHAFCQARQDEGN